MLIATTPEIVDLAKRGAWFVFSVSGGKDSGAALHAGCAWLDEMGHPRDRRIALHADLQRAEWPETLDTVRRVADHVGIRCETTFQTKDLLWRFEDRWRRCLDRYAALEAISLPTPWSSSSSLFCRSEQKEVSLSRYKAALADSLPVVGITGLRRQESARRAGIDICSVDGAMKRRNNRAGLLWNPIAEWSADEVFAYHAANGIPLHRAYSLGSTRLSCAYCVLASRNDLTVAYTSGENLSTYRAYVALEIRSAFSFQPSAWLADLADDEQTNHDELARAKEIATERRALQAELPKTLLKAKSIQNIERPDAVALARVRKRIGELYGIQPIGTDADEIILLSKGVEVAKS